MSILRVKDTAQIHLFHVLKLTQLEALNFFGPFVQSLMNRVTAPGKMAAWIAPPDRGINANPIDYKYVKL